MFTPVNRYILVDTKGTEEESTDPLIVLPEDYKPQGQQYRQVKVVCSAEDVRFEVKKGQALIVDWSMVEEIKISGTIYNVVLDNYVVGMIK
jgi:co-chaperonin GroES (HSP10)